MNFEQLIDEMVAIASVKIEPNSSTYFADIALPNEVIREGCRRILRWLRAQTVAFQMKPVKLEIGLQQDRSCVQLMEASPSLRQIFDVTDGYLHFARNLSYEQQERIALWSKTKDDTPLFWTERK